MIEIPKPLLDQIKEGNVVLFLGAGALNGAIHRDGKDAPSGPQLAGLIANKFLEEGLSDSSLQMVSEIAISETGLYPVQKFIADIFNGFEPNDFHKKIPLYRWQSIVTTNYDLVIEKAYSNCENQKQTLVKFVRDERINDKLKTINDLPFIKLHGCITIINDSKLPLILTTDQYVTHKKNRTRLFERINDLARQYTFLFVGHSLEDSDIREVLLNLGNDLTARMRSYIVTPDVKPALERYWGTKKITTLSCRFSEFMDVLEKKIDINSIQDGNSINIQANSGHPVLQRLFKSSSKPSEILINFISNDIIYPKKSHLQCLPILASEFYKGNVNSFAPIEEEFDVRRQIENGILSEVFVDVGNEDSSIHVYSILGHAGSGKTVFLNRLAWEVVNSLNKNCYILKKGILLDAEAVLELYSLLKERIYLIVDNANYNEIELNNLIERAKKDSVPLTILTAERTNIWNVECSRIKNHVEHSYRLQYLSEKEIDDLLDLLDMNNCLNHLKGKSREYQRKEFGEQAGRELLVALYEATQGKSFQEIVYDEYQSIPDEQAKSIYLTICLLHSLGSYMRAGLLSRVHSVNFDDFKTKFFAPLEYLVFSRRDYYINDFVYEARHQLIAEFVVNNVLSNEQQRYDEYVKLLCNLDTDYDSDRKVFLFLTNAKKLLKFFKTPDKIRRIYEMAKEQSYEDAKLYQQEAIFEMESNGGSIDKAEKLLYKADELTNNRDRLIRHSLSELLYIKATNAHSGLERKKLLNEVDKLCKSLIKKRNFSAHPFHTAIKAKLLLISDYIDNCETFALEKLIKETESLISLAIQQFPDDSHILEAESHFNSLINNEPKALLLLEKAFEVNKNSPYLSKRLASVYESNGSVEKAISTIKATLSTNAGDRDLNFKLGLLLIKENEQDELLTIKHHLRRSFSPNDNRYHAQFWYARALYLLDEIPDSQKLFNSLKIANLDPKIKNNIRGFIKDNANLKIYKGEIYSLHLNYGFIKRDGLCDTIFFSMHVATDGEQVDFTDISFDNLRRGTRVEFNLGFNYRGPIAVNIMPA